jgi:hypothetical protein
MEGMGRTERAPLAAVTLDRPRIAARPAVIAAVVLGVAVAAWSLYVRTRAFGAAYWIDEGLSIGIAKHSLVDIPGVLRQDGSPPLYYLLLHFWIGAFGTTEHATHALSLVFSMLTIPAGYWAGSSLFDRRAGLLAAVFCAANPFVTTYAQETRMYSLVVLLSVLCTAFLLHVFVLRHRGYLPLLAVTLVAMLYTHLWSAFFVLGAGVTVLWLIGRGRGQRRELFRDAVIAFGGAALLFLPWLPTALYQLQHTAAPWAAGPTWRAAQQIPHTLIGKDREIAITAIVTAIGLGLAFRERGRRDTRVAAVGLGLLAAVVAIAWTGSQVSSVWVPRYFAIFLGPLLLLLGYSFARARVIGIAGLAFLCAAFWLWPHTPRPTFKSNASLVAADGAPRLRPGDLVLSTHPEQIPLLYHYLTTDGATRLRYATELGYVPDPQVMDWRDAMTRLRHSHIHNSLLPMLQRMRPGQHLYLVRPILSRKAEWSAPWTQLVKHRTFQWVRHMRRDHRFKLLHVSNAWLQVGQRNGAIRGEMYVKTRR